MLCEADRTREPLLAVTAEVDNAVSTEVLVEIHASTGRIVAQFACIHIWVVLDVVHKQVAIAVDLLLELAVTDVALVQHSRALVLFQLELSEVFAAGLRLRMVLANVVLQRLDSVVVLVAQVALVPMPRVCRLVFHQVALVGRLEAAFIATVELAGMLPHVSIQITCNTQVGNGLFR